MAFSFPIDRSTKQKSSSEFYRLDFQRIVKSRFFYHLIGWPIFILYELSLLKFIDQASGSDFVIWQYLVTYLISAIVFYIHYLFVLAYCFESKNKKPLSLVVLVVLELALYLLLVGLFKKYLLHGKGFLYSLYPDRSTFLKQLWRGIYFLILSTATWIIQRNFDQLKKAKEIEKEALIKEQEKKNLELKLISTRNAYLQSQINPHFLFNTLNFIYSEVHEVSPMASEVIMTLSEMMRYSLLENKADGTIQLEREMDQIENLIKINQYRFDGELHLNFQSSGDIEAVRMTPLLLVPFVENLFKYAELSDAEYPAKIKIHVENQWLEFSTSNKKKRTIQFRSPGIGIQNVRTRLESFYPNRHVLKINESEGFYSVSLRIQY